MRRPRRSPRPFVLAASASAQGLQFTEQMGLGLFTSSDSSHQHAVDAAPLSIPSTGTYEVYAWWTFHPTVQEIIVNQHDAALGGQWNLIRVATPNAGTVQYVEVSSENGQASADAVRLVLQ